ncbi:MAG: hypothetical protein ACI4HI_17275 [Lachnospiraceae bacterium]
MFVQIIREYVSAFTWEKMKKLFKNREFLISFILCVITILITGGMLADGKHSVWNVGSSFCVSFPILYILVSGNLHALPLKKQMYLCPMDAQERKKYVKRSFYVRVAVDLLFSVGFGLPLLFDARYGGFVYFVYAWNSLELSLLVAHRTVEEDPKDSFFCTVLFWVNLFLFFGQRKKDTMQWISLWLYMGVLAVYIFYFSRRLNRKLNQMIYYEDGKKEEVCA